MEAFNEDRAAKEAIATSPDVTDGVEQLSAPTETQEQAVIKPKQAVNSEPTAWDQRNARLLTKGLKSLSSGNGGELDDDQLSAIEDLTAEGFGILSALNAPKAVKIGITAALVIIPFIPVGFAVKSIFKDSKEEKPLDIVG